MLTDWKPVRMPVQLPLLPSFKISRYHTRVWSVEFIKVFEQIYCSFYGDFHDKYWLECVNLCVKTDWKCFFRMFSENSWSWLLKAWIPVYFFHFLIIVLSYLPCYDTVIGFTFHRVCSGNHHHQTPNLLRVKTSVIQGDIVSHRTDI